MYKVHTCYAQLLKILSFFLTYSAQTNGTNFASSEFDLDENEASGSQSDGGKETEKRILKEGIETARQQITALSESIRVKQEKMNKLEKVEAADEAKLLECLAYQVFFPMENSGEARWYHFKELKSVIDTIDFKPLHELFKLDKLDSEEWFNAGFKVMERFITPIKPSNSSEHNERHYILYIAVAGKLIPLHLSRDAYYGVTGKSINQRNDSRVNVDWSRYPNNKLKNDVIAAGSKIAYKYVKFEITGTTSKAENERVKLLLERCIFQFLHYGGMSSNLYNTLKADKDSHGVLQECIPDLSDRIKLGLFLWAHLFGANFRFFERTTNQLKDHVKNITSLQHNCAQCSFSAPTLKGLAQHLKKHVRNSDIRKFEHKCTFCTEMFSNAVEMQQHWFVVHHEKNENRCEICKKSFTNKHHLTAHIQNFHTPKNGETAKKKYNVT